MYIYVGFLSYSLRGTQDISGDSVVCIEMPLRMYMYGVLKGYFSWEVASLWVIHAHCVHMGW